MHQDTQKDCLVWSHSQLHHAALKVAIGLKDRGLRPDSMVAFFVQNSIEWAVSIIASTILPFTAALLDVGALSPARTAELEYFMKTLRPSAVVIQSSKDIKLVDAAIEAVGLEAALRVFIESEETIKSPENWTFFPEIAISRDPSNEEGNTYLEKAKEPLIVLLSFSITGSSHNADAGASFH